MVGGRATAGRGGARGQAVGGRAREALAGGHRMVEARGEAAAAVHHCALLGQLLQDASSSEGRATGIRSCFLYQKTGV